MSKRKILSVIVAVAIIGATLFIWECSDIDNQPTKPASHDNQTLGLPQELGNNQASTEETAIPDNQATAEDSLPVIAGYNNFPGSWKFPFFGSYKITVGYYGNVCGGGFDQYHTGTNKFALDWSRLPGDGDIGDPIPAPASGWATVQYSNSGLGNSVTVNAGNGYSYVIGHMDEIYLNYCGWVERGQILGTLGCSGWCDGAHIHFVVYRNGTSVPQNGISGQQDLQLCSWYSSGQ